MKCNGSLKFLESHIKLLNELYFDNKKCDVVICPLSIHLMLLKPLVRKEIQLSAQNISHRGEGAFTGEIAANQVSNIGVNWTVVGQSERRNFFNETDEIVGEKVMLAQQSKLKVIACLGETLDDCELTYNNLPACFKHLEAIAKNVINWEDIVLVYNPVWAIGNKDSYDRDHIQKVHYELRNWIKTNVSEPVSNSVQIVYGGRK